MEDQLASVRYIVSDVATCVDFYLDRLGFKVEMHPSHGFAALSHGDLRLYLNAPKAGGGGNAGGTPSPGGWNRFMIEVDDLDGLISRLREAGERFRGEIATGPGGRQILLEDPSGNVVELFQPAR
jgi:catechol 2,3-dioxygenase-like lactoylglutathione lyase family enzyme